VSDLKKILLCTAMMLLSLLIIGCSDPEETEDGDSDNDRQVTEGNLPTPVPGNGSEEGMYETVEIYEGDFRAVWVVSVFNLDFPSKQDLTVAAMKREIDTIISRTIDMGLNAVIFQVRPTGDSLYESDLFPWSNWLTGTQGQGPPDFDPLAYWIEACHENDVELHAWLNPYRIIHTATDSSDPGILSPRNPVYVNPELAVGWSTSGGRRGLFLDPGLPEARQLILDGIKEIITRYDVDGIHIDDYFYPGTEFNDAASFGLYGSGMELADWRRENVNTLIRDIQSVIREHNEQQGKNVRWGISPTAIWKNSSSDPLGVPTTRGQESYHALYADTRRWVMEEWVDYICPQIYWYIGNEVSDFEAVLNWWIELCMDYNVDLYIGHAAYREHEEDQHPHWEGEILRQLEMAESSDVVKGHVFYRFGSLRGILGNDIRFFYMGEDEELLRQPVMILDTLSVGMPAQDITLNATADNAPGYNVVGTSIPDLPLFMNGEEVTNRTIEGFFFIYVTLESGVNEFTFSQEGHEDVTRKITRNAPGGGGGSASATITRVTTTRYATVTSNDAWLYPSNSVSGASGWMLVPGQRDRVIAESSNNYVKLSCGMWVNQNAVSIQRANTVTENVLRNGVYRTGTDHDIIAWQSDEFPAIYAVYDGSSLTVSFGMHTEAPPLTIDNLSQTVLSGFSSGIDDGVPYYKFDIRNDVRYEGQFVEYEDGEFRIYLKKRKTLSQGEYPLTGITIVIDPGHGGEASGAIGPLGYEMPEKELNLINSLKLSERLKALGAEVHLTRDADIDISLQERVNISWRHRPDLFVSLHINSVGENINARNVRGFTVWYRNPNSINAAQTFLDNMFMVNPGTTRREYINHANFFVCRPAWAPSILLEASFIINIDDFVWLIDPVQQDIMADATVDAILEYFSR